MAAFRVTVTPALPWFIGASLSVVVALHAVLVVPRTAAATGARSGQGGDRCPWDQYYDDHVDSCGPCIEICNNMALTGTEEQCKSQCSAYLESKSCDQVDEFFDEANRSCAPCSELCRQRDTNGTSKECHRKCDTYLVSKSCDQVDEYFDEANRACAPCSELCRQRDTNGTSKECHRKCHKFLEKAQPGNSQHRPMDVNVSQNRSTSSSPSWSWSAGIIASAVVGVVAMTVLVGFVLHHRYYSSATRHAPAGPGGVRYNPVLPKETPQPIVPVQVSSEDVGSGDISLQIQADTQPEYGMPEIDRVAPSSAAYLHVCQHPSR